MKVLALTSDAGATESVLGVLGDALDAGAVALGDRLLVFDDAETGELAGSLRQQEGVLAVVSEAEARPVAAVIEPLIGDPVGAAAAVGSLLGVGVETLEPDVVGDALSWLLAMNPALEAEKASRPRAGETWDFDGACVVDEGPPPPPPPESPLRSPRFAGDPELEQCLAGQYRMMEPEESRAVLKIQQALLDLRFALPDHGADGKFGPETGAAVSAFKASQGIEPSDPVVGPGTMARLDELFAV